MAFFYYPLLGISLFIAAALSLQCVRTRLANTHLRAGRATLVSACLIVLSFGQIWYAGVKQNAIIEEGIYREAQRLFLSDREKFFQNLNADIDKQDFKVARIRVNSILEIDHLDAPKVHSVEASKIDAAEEKMRSEKELRIQNAEVARNLKKMEDKERRARESEKNLQLVQAERIVKEYLKDPKSAIFRELFHSGKAVCGEVNARNSFGAYIGYQKFVNRGRVVIMEGQPLFVSAWNDLCVAD